MAFLHRRIFLLGLVGACLVGSSAFIDAAEADVTASNGGLGQALDQAARQKLSSAPEWRRLIHMPRGRSEGEIGSKDFYLAGDGRQNPGDELTATIRAWFESAADANDSVRCRYPARYTWLSEHIDLPDFDPAFTACTTFRRWARLNDLRSISVLFVSGYLSNPASSFGHSLLKFDYGDTKNRHQLLDTTFSFGALVPPDENMLAYIVRGITGGYAAGFSDHPYYDKDQVYTHREFRDIWRYQLALTPAQRFIVVAHLWEITAKKFRYYFLTKNCTYRMGEVLGLVTNGQYTPRARLWYAPVELFYALSAKPSLVSSVSYIPSYQRRFYAVFDALSADQKKAFRAIIEHSAFLRSASFESRSVAARSRIIEAVVAYYDYRLPSAADDRRPALKARRHRALLARLGLPPRRHAVAEPSRLPAPTTVHPPIRLGIGATTSNFGDGLTLAWSPHFRDGLSNVYPAIKEFEVLNTRLTLSSNTVRLSNLTLFKVRQFGVAPAGIPEERHLSWGVTAAVDRGFVQDRALDLQLSGQLGRSTFVMKDTLGYLTFAGEARLFHTDVIAGPRVGLAHTRGALGFEISGQAAYAVRDRRLDPRLTAAVAWAVNLHDQIRFSAHSTVDDTQVTVSFNRYW